MSEATGSRVEETEKNDVDAEFEDADARSCEVRVAAAPCRLASPLVCLSLRGLAQSLWSRRSFSFFCRSSWHALKWI